MNRTLYLESFQHAASQIVKKGLALRQLEVWVGTYLDCVVLKLYKKSWANPLQDPVTSPSRIFFAVWIDPAREQELSYNIHALKMRQFKGYKIESRKFADAFRKSFKKFAHKWENASIKFGPLTLMQGFVKIEPDGFQDEVLRLANGFLEMDHLIDDTLARFKV